MKKFKWSLLLLLAAFVLAPAALVADDHCSVGEDGMKGSMMPTEMEGHDDMSERSEDRGMSEERKDN